MIGAIVELLISWLLLWLFERKHLSALGVRPTRERLRHFLEGLLLPVILLSLFYWLVSLAAQNPWRLNPQYGWKDLGNASAYLFWSVAYENLIFTGALLYILIRRIGATRAIWISALSFGVYHWFSYELWGQWKQMLIVFVLTAWGGYIFALAFEKTRSLYLPFALHFGLDFVPMILFSKEKGIGRQLLIPTFAKDPVAAGDFVQLLLFLLHFIVVPLLIWLWLRRLKHAGPAAGAVEKA